MGEWTFFSNYGHVLVCLARNREARLRDVAEQVGITERAVQKIVRDLQSAGYISVSKRGRCNRYRINRRKSLRHGLESHCTVGKLLTLVAQRSHSPEPDEAENLAAVEEVVSTKPIAVAVEPETTAAGEPSARGEKKGGKKQKPTADSREQGSLF